MAPDDLVTASLAALANDEIVCVPQLPDAALFAGATEAQVEVFRASAMQPTLPERYRAA